MGGEASGGEAARPRSLRRSMVQVLSLLPETPVTGNRISPKVPPPPASPQGQSTVSSQGLTSDRCWQLRSRGLESHTVKNTLRMPFLNSDPRSRCCRQPRSGTCQRDPPGCTQPNLCRDRADAAWGPGFPLCEPRISTPGGLLPLPSIAKPK